MKFSKFSFPKSLSAILVYTELGKSTFHLIVYSCITSYYFLYHFHYEPLVINLLLPYLVCSASLLCAEQSPCTFLFLSDFIQRLDFQDKCFLRLSHSKFSKQYLSFKLLPPDIPLNQFYKFRVQMGVI